MFIFAFLLIGSEASAESPLERSGGNCLVCHAALEDDVASLWPKDIHAQLGIECVVCHGGDPSKSDMDLAKSEDSGFFGIPRPEHIAKLCGSCHSDASYMSQFNPLSPVDQWAQYALSQHGQAMAKKDRNAANCVSCHGYHGITKIHDPSSSVHPFNVTKTCAQCHADEQLMNKYGISPTVEKEYLGSVHAKALLVQKDLHGAPTCNDCHGDHEVHSVTVQAITSMCGKCHAQESQLFLESPMALPLQTAPFKACVTCHDSHNIQSLPIGTLEDQCKKCHIPGDAGMLLASHYTKSFADLNQRFFETQTIFDRAHSKDMDVEEARESLHAAQYELNQARIALHAFSIEKLQPAFSQSEIHVKAAQLKSLEALEQYKIRRRGLLISCLLLFLFTLLLGWKIRTLKDSENVHD